MKKYNWLIIITLVIAGIISTAVITVIFSNKPTAEIPSASKVATTTKDWTVHFSKSMDPNTFTKETVRILDENDQPADVSFEWNSTNTILTLKAPTNGYMEDKNYVITISDDVKADNGKNLSKPFIHNFTALGDLPNIQNNEQLLTLLNERMENHNQTFYSEEESAEIMSVSEDQAAASPEGNSVVSETNVQVAGVDEGDIMKTDGEFVYFARQNDIVITTADQQNSTAVTSIREDNFQPSEIYLEENVLISIGHRFESIREEPTTENDAGSDIAIYPAPVEQTAVYIYDISDKENPEKIREITVEGYLNASRKMDGYLYLVANQYPRFHILEEMEKDMEARPFIKDTAVSERAEPLSFENMYYFPDSEDTNYLLLASIDLHDLDKEAKVESFLGASNNMYMSENHIYLAQTKFDITSSNGNAEMAIASPNQANTEIFQFHVDKGEFNFKTSTVVNGTLINQFAMDERNDTFRVATTQGFSSQEDNTSTNNLYTFDLELNPLGAVEGLAEGEQIFSVRFMEDIAYMVTFEQIDPLFVIDLENPENPEVLGELKIPGFSNYLHPLDDNHVIGFGQHTKLVENEHSSEPQVRMDGLKISLFDVSDPTNPIEKDSEILGRGGSYSEITHNHNALYEHPERNLFGFPAVLFESKTVQQGDATYEDQSFVYEGAFLYHITPENGIQLSNSLTHQKEVQQKEYPDYESEIKRMISVGDFLYTFSYDQFTVYDINEKLTIHEVQLPKMTNSPGY
ncbi:beta-propeller domain-containing protein [Oceanobacillus salinisoli]|uniref:beta-propeller domain-containing protein n=1 Tax=Oceanobacillus salinisoli TaxID=2678611 RepID=UPI0012E1874B|nr:beta-propeller domain-containing protein [Oceanobacillus salinisoli]